MERYKLFAIFFTSIMMLSSCLKNEHSSEIETEELSIKLSVEDLGSEGRKKAQLSFEVAQGWHIYGPLAQKNGRPTSISFSLPEAQFRDSLWPQTKNFDEGENGISQGYEGSFKVETNFQASSSLKNPLVAKVTWVACRQICVPGEAELKTSLN